MMATTTTTSSTTNCYFCGKEIHFDPNIKSERGKYIPLSGKRGTAKHRCSERPFNKKEAVVVATKK